MDKISIIITAYNEEKYLLAALNSIKNQTYKNIEIIFVNDGSADLSLKIAQNFQQTCPFPMKIINQPNMGVAMARNNALRAITGNYLMFLDGDDYLEPTALEQMLKMAKMNDIPIVKSSFQTLHGKLKVKDTYNGNKDKEGNIINIKKNKDWLILAHVGIGGKLFQTTCWENLTFPDIKGSHVPEDLAIMPYVYVKAQYIGIAPPNLFNYRRHFGSLTNVKTRKISTYYIDSPKSLKYLEQLFKENGYYEEYKDQLYKMNLIYRQLDALYLLTISWQYSLPKRLKIFRYLETLAFNELQKFGSCPTINQNEYAWWWSFSVKVSNIIMSSANLNNPNNEQILQEAQRILLKRT